MRLSLPKLLLLTDAVAGSRELTVPIEDTRLGTHLDALTFAKPDRWPLCRRVGRDTNRRSLTRAKVPIWGWAIPIPNLGQGR